MIFNHQWYSRITQYFCTWNITDLSWIIIMIADLTFAVLKFRLPLIRPKSVLDSLPCIFSIPLTAYPILSLQLRAWRYGCANQHNPTRKIISLTFRTTIQTINHQNVGEDINPLTQIHPIKLPRCKT